MKAGVACREWIGETAAMVRALAPHQLVSLGSEGAPRHHARLRRVFCPFSRPSPDRRHAAARCPLELGLPTTATVS